MLAIPSTQLWTPRAGAWWRRPFRRPDSLLMAHIKKGASGHMLKTGTGHLSKGCLACSNCSNSVSRIRVAVAGMSWSPTPPCTGVGVFGNSMNVDSGGSPPNGTYDLDFSAPSYCDFGLDFDPGITYIASFSNNCEPDISRLNMTARVAVVFSSSYYRLLFSSRTTPSGIFFDSGTISATAPYLCSSLSVSNTSSGAYAICTGGSATIDAI